MKEDLKSVLYEALAEDIGIRLASEEPQRLIAQLHVARKEAADPALSVLVIAISRVNPDGEVWLVKKEIKADAEKE